MDSSSSSSFKEPRLPPPTTPKASRPRVRRAPGSSGPNNSTSSQSSSGSANKSKNSDWDSDNENRENFDPVPKRVTRKPTVNSPALKRPKPVVLTQEPPKTSTSAGGVDTADIDVLMDIGDGNFGRVMLAYDRKNPTSLMAIKMIDVSRNQALVTACRMEALLLRKLRGHPNVIQYLSMRVNNDFQFQIFMEYADGGEIFDLIEPDKGIPIDKAQFLFRQLIDGLHFIHSNDIVHRDIKPENLLMTKSDVLKICDFGFATQYRKNGEEIMLEDRYGTPEYTAPEVYASTYRGEPVDVWSAGVVLMVMLTGDLPWEEPLATNGQFREFVLERNITKEPWCRIGTAELALINTMVVLNPSERTNFDTLQKHPWVQGIEPRRKSHSPLLDFGYIESQTTHTASSQPAGYGCEKAPTRSQFIQDRDLPKNGLPSVSFSQPAGVESLLLSTSQVVGPSQGYINHPIQTFVRRMTRFCSQEQMFDLIEHIEEACHALGCKTSFITSQQIRVTTMIRRKELRYVIRVYEMHEESGVEKKLVDVRCSYGCGVGFKRAFAALRQQLHKYICTESDEWLRNVGLLPNIAIPILEPIEAIA